MKKSIIRFCAILMAALFATSVTAYAATAPVAAGNALAGVNINILDMTTLATMHGIRGNNSYFTAADGRALGVMSTNDVNAVIARVAVREPDGWRPPGVGYGFGDWGRWFAGEFNRLHGIGADSRQSTNLESVAIAERFTPEWIEAERREVIRLVNLERERNNLPSLESNRYIMSAAQIRARELAAHYSHERPDGSRWYTVFAQAEVREWPNGENIHRAVASAESAMNGWMRSEGHRNNLLSERAVTIGVGFYMDENGRLFWVQVFGR